MRYDVWVYDVDDITELEIDDALIISKDVSEEDALALARLCKKYHHNVAMFPIIEDATQGSDPVPW